MSRPLGKSPSSSTSSPFSSVYKWKCKLKRFHFRSRKILECNSKYCIHSQVNLWIKCDLSDNFRLFWWGNQIYFSLNIARYFFIQQNHFTFHENSHSIHKFIWFRQKVGNHSPGLGDKKHIDTYQKAIHLLRSWYFHIQTKMVHSLEYRSTCHRQYFRAHSLHLHTDYRVAGLQYHRLLEF